MAPRENSEFQLAVFYIFELQTRWRISSPLGLVFRSF